MTPLGSIERRRSLEKSSSGHTSPYSLSSGAMALVAGSLDGGVGRPSSVSLALGKVYSRAFLAANHVITCINRIAIRLLAKDRPLTLDRLYALYDVAISYCLGVDLYLLTLYT